MVGVGRCAACGSSYRMHERLAGKTAKCLCGEPLRVPAAMVGTESPPQEVKQEDKPSRPSSPAERDRSGKRRERTARPLGAIIGVLAIFYGGVMTLVFLGGMLSGGPSLLTGLTSWWPLGRLVAAAVIAAGGVLIFKGHEHGPACTGIACVILCFFPLWHVLQEASGVLSVGSLGGFLLVLVRSAVVYCIPVYVAVWCLKEEMAKEEDADERG